MTSSSELALALFGNQARTPAPWQEQMILTREDLAQASLALFPSVALLAGLLVVCGGGSLLQGQFHPMAFCEVIGGVLSVVWARGVSVNARENAGNRLVRYFVDFSWEYDGRNLCVNAPRFPLGDLPVGIELSWRLEPDEVDRLARVFEKSVFPGRG